MFVETIFLEYRQYVLYSECLVLLVGVVSISNKRHKKSSWGSLLFSLYLVLIMMLSLFYNFRVSNLFRTLEILIILQAFNFGKLYEKRFGHTKFIRSIFNFSLLYLAYFVLVQFMDFDAKGMSSYAGGFNLGTATSRKLIFLPLLVIILFREYTVNKSNGWYLLIIGSTILLIGLIFRRTLWVILILGLLVSFLDIRRLLSSLKYVVIFSLFAGIFFGVFRAQIESQLNHRLNQGSYTDVQQEARFIEILSYYESYSGFSLREKLIGQPLLFITDSFWGAIMAIEHRTIHSDAIYLLYSTGIIGFTLYLFWIFEILLKAKKLQHSRREYRMFLFLALLPIILLPGGTFLYPFQVFVGTSYAGVLFSKYANQI